MTNETELDKLLDIQGAVTLYDEVAGMLYEIALVEPDDAVTEVVCKIAGWLDNRSDALSDEADRICDSLLKKLS